MIGTFELIQQVLRQLNVDTANKEEMIYEEWGQQPVVVLK